MLDSDFIAKITEIILIKIFVINYLNNIDKKHEFFRLAKELIEKSKEDVKNKKEHLDELNELMKKFNFFDIVILMIENLVSLNAIIDRIPSKEQLEILLLSYIFDVEITEINFNKYKKSFEGKIANFDKEKKKFLLEIFLRDPYLFFNNEVFNEEVFNLLSILESERYEGIKKLFA
jgi:hypothetical protein